MDLALELDLHLNESARTVFTTLADTLAAGYTAGTISRTGRRKAGTNKDARQGSGGEAGA